jgi:crotonobetainyl-CoA:carnitine CoA-transferase CaiB-like acyl-CoA transferase
MSNPNPSQPLEGVRILAVEQMQALPFATQLFSRLGADVVKIEHPEIGDAGRGALPAIRDTDGRQVGATYLRNNLGKRSVALDLKHPEGREIFKRLVPRFDVVGENFKPGTMARLGLAYEDLAAIHPGLVYVSVSGFGNLGESPYASFPAYAPIAEAMSGLYEYKREPDEPPQIGPAGALGDIGTSLFAAIAPAAASTSTWRCSTRWWPWPTSCRSCGPWACARSAACPASSTASGRATVTSSSRPCASITWPSSPA